MISSLRANGSRECARDDRLREAIQRFRGGGLDCFVASLLAMTELKPYAVFSNSSRPISMRRISLVPAPIS
jgi:hypothetical protein